MNAAVSPLQPQLTEAELLEALGLPDLTPQTLWRYRNEGMPHVPMARGQYFYSLEKVRTWMTVHGKTGVQGRPKKGDLPEELKKELTEVRIQKERVLVAKHQHLLDRAQGLVLTKQEVEEGRLARVAAVKAGLLALPGKLSQRLAMRDAVAIQRELEDEVRSLLHAFAGHQGPDATAEVVENLGQLGVGVNNSASLTEKKE